MKQTDKIFNDKLDLFQKLYDNPNFNIGARGITSAGYAARARSQFIYSKLSIDVHLL